MLKDKIESACSILSDADKISKQGFKFILFSGGKDSIVVSHLARKMLGIQNAFNEDSCVPPYLKDEVKGIGDSLGLNVYYNTRLNPKNFVQHWKNQIPPKKWKPSDLDCIRHWLSIPEYAKRTSATMMIFGRRKQENTIPKPIYYKKNFKPLQVHPIWNWTWEDVWEYIELNNLQTPSCYRDGSKHLLTWVSLAQKCFKETNSMKKTYDVIYKHAPEYVKEMAKHDEMVNEYVKSKDGNI